MGRPDLNRRVFGALGASALGGFLLSGPASAQDEFAATREVDRVGRSTVPVFLDDQGPFRFAIDTAASASVIAADLAERLALPAGGELDMHTVIGLERVRATRVGRLSSGALGLDNARLAIGSRAGLIGLDGLLGLDLLAGQRLVMRLRGGGRSSIARSRINDDAFLGAVRPRVRFAPQMPGTPVRLMLAQAFVRGQEAQAIIDTGAQVSLINTALAAAAGARPLVFRNAGTGRSVQSPTGRSEVAVPMVLQSVRFDELVLDRLAVLMGDFHIFRHLGLGETPAMLLGVDVLGAFERVVIDLKRGEIVMDI